MTVQSRPVIVEIVSEGAPFTIEQRMWLNGFFAGLVSLDSAGLTPLTPEQKDLLLKYLQYNAKDFQPEAEEENQGS